MPRPCHGIIGVERGVRMCTQGEVRAIVADMRARLEGLFPQQQIDAILFGSYARGDA